jgi:hypothetical protein
MDEEEMGLRYLEVYGFFGNYTVITDRKKINCLNKFRYLSPNEYHKFKQNMKEPTYKEKELINKYYIGSKISWILNNKLRTGQKLKMKKLKYQIYYKIFVKVINVKIL